MRGNGGPPRRIRRRTALKSITGTTAAAVGITTATTISASGPEGVAVSPEETTVPNPDIEYRVIDKSVKRITAKYPLLTLEEDTVLTFINDSGLPSDRRSEAADAARKLRRMYPTTEKQEGNVIRVTLAEESNDRTERTRHLVDRAFKAFRMGAVDR